MFVELLLYLSRKEREDRATSATRPGILHICTLSVYSYTSIFSSLSDDTFYCAATATGSRGLQTVIDLLINKFQSAFTERAVQTFLVKLILNIPQV